MPAPAAATVLVVKSTSPAMALVVVFRVIAWSLSMVVKLPVPDTVSAPVWVIVPSVAVTDRLPSTVEAPKAMAVALTIVALPVVPLVVRVMPPVTASVPRSMSASLALVMNVAPPADTVKVPSSMMLPNVAVMLVAPPTAVLAARLTPVALTIVAVPAPLVLSSSVLVPSSVCAS